MSVEGFGKAALPPFGRKFFDSDIRFSRIGAGEIGGKAQGLVFAQDVLGGGFDANRFSGITVDIPASVVLTSDVFDAFIKQNNLLDGAVSDLPDDRMALAFQEASFPMQYVGDLRGLIEDVHSPLAVRSSSLLEDAMFQPFAGVYETKMIPNNQPDPDERFRKLIEAVKFVYSSMFTRSAKAYLMATDKTVKDEKMGVVIQEVVGARYGDRFYPHLSGVARSYNYYPSGRSRPEEGVVSLALGLGKTVVDGGVCWSYSPVHPKAPPPFGSVHELLKNTQIMFWAVNMGRPAAYDPIRETEYLVEEDLKAAEYDGTLKHLASTYDARSDRLVMGTGADGARVLNFAPLLELQDFPVNDLIKNLMSVCEDAAGAAVEIEFAMTFPSKRNGPARFAFLQVRPMVVSDEVVDIDETEMEGPRLLLTSNRTMGNGVEDAVADVVYVKPVGFEAKATRAIAGELGRINRDLMDEKRPYLLIGFGRWGSSDPWLGIPVQWGHVGGARVLVEATLPDMNVELSQGSHFFHNLSSFGVSYFSVRHTDEPGIDWKWLDDHAALSETDHVRHVRLDRPLVVRVDGRSGRGIIETAETGDNPEQG